MKRAIIIHGWDEKPTGQWLPWMKQELENIGWVVETPEMPNTKNPKLNEWMNTLQSLSPDEETLLIGHSLGNALILRYLENPTINIRGAILVAAWDWLMEDIREYHETFFQTTFDYTEIKSKQIPITIINSTNDPYIDFEKSKLLAEKIGAKFVGIENAGHFMARDGYTEFPKVLEVIKKTF